jgi:hypothetical protein
MILALDTNGSYLLEPNGKSRAAAYLYLTKSNNPHFHNGTVLILLASASETELAALFYGCKEATPLCMTLEKRVHSQPGLTPITTDNSTAVGLTMDTIIPKASKEMDMRFQWLKCQWAQSLFPYLWAKGIKNRADYPSKHHLATHHQCVCPLYVFDRLYLNDAQTHLFSFSSHTSPGVDLFCLNVFTTLLFQHDYLLDARFPALVRVC